MSASNSNKATLRATTPDRAITENMKNTKLCQVVPKLTNKTEKKSLIRVCNTMKYTSPDTNVCCDLMII